MSVEREQLIQDLSVTAEFDEMSRVRQFMICHSPFAIDIARSQFLNLTDPEKRDKRIGQGVSLSDMRRDAARYAVVCLKPALFTRPMDPEFVLDAMTRLGWRSPDHSKVIDLSQERMKRRQI